ncbi:MAG: hypothetical protein ACLQME_20320 [Alphaproteobacteria bacterium]
MAENDIRPVDGIKPPTGEDHEAVARAAFVCMGGDGTKWDQRMQAVKEKHGLAAPVSTTDAPGARGALFQTNEASRVLPLLSEDKAKKFAANLVRQGADPAQVEAALKRSGYEIEPDERTPEQKAYDAKFGLTEDGVSPDAYHVDSRLAPNASTAQVAAFSAEARGFASDLNLSPEIGTSLISQIMETARELDSFDPRTPAVRAEWELQQKAKFNSHFGAANVKQANEDVELALSFADEKFVAKLRQSGVLNHWYIRAQLANQGAHMGRWARGREE